MFSTNKDLTKPFPMKLQCARPPCTTVHHARPQQCTAQELTSLRLKLMGSLDFEITPSLFVLVAALPPRPSKFLPARDQGQGHISGGSSQLLDSYVRLNRKVGRQPWCIHFNLLFEINTCITHVLPAADVIALVALVSLTMTHAANIPNFQIDCRI